MLRDFYLTVIEDQELTAQIAHIQYNIHKRLARMTYLKHKRMDVRLLPMETEPESIDISWDDGRQAIIDCNVSKETVRLITSLTEFEAAYDCFFKVLHSFWRSRAWNMDDLKNIFDQIRFEQYSSSIYYGKKYKSPSGKRTAEFHCQLFPRFANYYLIISEKKTEVQRIQFLKGTPEVEMFFDFFNYAGWNGDEFFEVADFNREIVLVFDLVKMNFELNYFPRFNSLQQCKNYFLAFDFKNSPDERRRLFGIGTDS